jgi:hypothetical protein
MRRFVVRFSESEASNHTPSLAGFSVHTPVMGRSSWIFASGSARVARETKKRVEMVSCYEAGYDGFWLHRLLQAPGWNGMDRADDGEDGQFGIYAAQAAIPHTVLYDRDEARVEFATACLDEATVLLAQSAGLVDDAASSQLFADRGRVSRQRRSAISLPRYRSGCRPRTHAAQRSTRACGTRKGSLACPARSCKGCPSKHRGHVLPRRGRRCGIRPC